MFYELRFSQFRRQIAKKAMPTKPPNSLEKIGSSCSKEAQKLKRKDCKWQKSTVNSSPKHEKSKVNIKEPVHVIDVEVDHKEGKVEVVELSEEPGPV